VTWYYAKVYCGETVADRLLAEEIGPLSASLEQSGAIVRWFFVRYVDRHHHLRVRFLVSDARADEAAGALTARLAPAVAHELVWKIVPDVYEPEVERYGAATMATAERLFHHDSAMVAQAVRLIRASGDEHLRWQFGLAAIDRRLDGFGYGLADRARLLDTLATGFLPEFGEPGAVRQRIDRKARELRGAIDAALDTAPDPAPDRRHGNEALATLLPLIDTHTAATAGDREELLRLSRAGTLEVPLEMLVASHLHMFCNRLFPTRQRLHELVLYLFLARHIRGRLARQGSPA
jgi:thiopeptide-type bacteriocin biosynthesis protein